MRGTIFVIPFDQKRSHFADLKPKTLFLKRPLKRSFSTRFFNIFKKQHILIEHGEINQIVIPQLKKNLIRVPPYGQNGPTFIPKYESDCFLKIFIVINGPKILKSLLK
jgi:hypothetical protein